MLKDFIKIQFIAILILVLNVIATQDIKLSDKKKNPVKKSEVTKVSNQMQLTLLSKSPALKALMKVKTN